MPPTHISYFGFGSLVNRDTRPGAEEATNATLKGWRRIWNHRVSNASSGRNCTSLSIEPAAGEIDGVIVKLPVNELAALDEREYGYERLSLDRSDFLLPEAFDTGPVFVYRSLGVNQHLADEQHPILQSYVDCVLAGYQQRFGVEGLQKMLLSTGGWDNPVFNDRLAPEYPRHVVLPEAKLHHFDTLLAPLR